MDSSLDSLGMRPRKQPRTVDYDDPITKAIEARIDPHNDRFAFGLTTFQVERFRRILSRMNGREVEMSEAWGRAAECMAMIRDMMEVLVKSDEPVRPVTVEDLPSYQPRQRAA